MNKTQDNKLVMMQETSSATGTHPWDRYGYMTEILNPCHLVLTPLTLMFSQQNPLGPQEKTTL